MSETELQAKQNSVKITLLGKGMVGKSSLTYRFINYNAPEEHDPTIEDKFMTVMDIDGKAVTINILDTAGQDDYQGLIDMWIDSGDGFLLVFALNDRESFVELDRKKSKIDAIKRKTKTPIILVGNKSDLENQRQVSKKEGEEKARQWGAVYYETSAKNDILCNEPFIECSRQLLKKDIGSSKKEVNKSSGGCCCVVY
jgi:small GTP-binding protein